jgi:hypothetical protein
MVVETRSEVWVNGTGWLFTPHSGAEVRGTFFFTEPTARDLVLRLPLQRSILSAI